MAESDNKIGDFAFLSLIGNVVPPTVQSWIDQRDALDGTSIMDSNVREPGPIINGVQTYTIVGRRQQGNPFTMMSRADAPNYTAAILEYDRYLTLCGDDPVSLTQGGVCSDSRGFQVVVLSVEMIRAARLSRSAGFLNSGGAILECRWNLIAVAI